MAFMEPQITRRLAWYQIGGPAAGLEYVPTYVMDAPARTAIEAWIAATPDTPGERDRVARDLPAALAPYCENRRAWSVAVIDGYGVRRSAPGYLDCTPWDVYTDRADAERAYQDLIAEDDAEDDGEN